MKLLILLVFASVLLLAGCRSTTNGHHTKTPTHVTHSSTQPTYSAPAPSASTYTTQDFVRDVRNADPYFNNVPAVKLLRDTKNVCTLFDEGKSTNYLITYEDARYPAYQAGEVIGAGVQGYCPQYSSKLPK